VNIRNSLNKGTLLPIQPTLLSIAGSDPSGGAGIQADLKTMTAIGVYGAAAVTCLTVQNSLGVQKIHPLPSDFVKDQIAAVLDDHEVSCIKIGMTGNAEIVEAISSVLHSFKGEVIYDPVLASTTGSSLLQRDSLVNLREKLLQTISYLTPNVSELQILSDIPIRSLDDAIQGATNLLNNSPLMKAVVIKGGHLNESNKEIVDYLVQKDGTVYTSQRIRHKNPHLHGTGCTYSTALASYLCQGNPLIQSFTLAGAYMDTIIRTGKDKTVSISQSNGPLLHFLT